MAFRSKRKGSNGNDKYLRLTGLWQSKNNDMLRTGKLKVEQLEDLLKKVEEALESEAPLIFGLWENDKKKSKRDPEFSLQCFVGDSEESPRSRRGSRDEDEEEDRPSRKSKRDAPEEEEAEEEEEEDEPEEEEEDSRSTRKGKSTRKGSTSRSSTKKSKRESW